ncbi:hypothetical protein RJ641_022151 [Dillenia turbinata]|uniref:Plasma membrane fusion protein PRM1 n=1 Tax=Dillenia turbinata TaxID=194707 RepID=A0AAN8UBT0_9MAGN
MSTHKNPKILSLLFTIFLFSSTSLAFFSDPPEQQKNPFFPDGNGERNDGVVSFGKARRSVAEGPIDGAFDDNNRNEPYSIVLAGERTYRRDPLNGFKKYTGGWDINERHYWASVGFTAAPLFIIAATWFLGFGLCLLLISLVHFCCRRQSCGYSRTAYVLSLLLLILFTICAIIGCVILYTGQGKFHTSTKDTVDYVVDQAEDTVDRLMDVSDYLAAAKLAGVDQVFLPSNVQSDIDQIGMKINSSANILSDRALKNSDDIHDVLDSTRMALVVVAAVMIFLTSLGLHTCVAMDQWVQNPTAHTSLDNVLPCVDNTTAQETLVRSKEVTSQLVDLVNQVITNVSNINFSPNFVPLYYNQSGPLLPLLCNPFRPDFTDRVCTPGEVDLDKATQVWSGYVCNVSPAGVCTTTGRLTPTLYSQMSTAVNMSYGLYNDAPFLIALEDCTFVRDTFSTITRDHCPGLLRYSKWICTGLVMVSTAVMLSLIFWVVYGRERRHRAFTKELTAGADHHEGGKSP